MKLTLINANKSFDGWLKQYTHVSRVLACEMRFSIFLPPQTARGQSVPVLYWLSGLTCTDENFVQKAGAFRKAAELGIALVVPDTSPRGENVADDEAYDLGQGAGFYLNATREPWSSHYHMYDYIVDELPTLIEESFPVLDIRSISGHSMGGHGAITIGLRNPDRYRAVSAFSPISHPTQCPWGQKAFRAYLGDDIAAWGAYDSSLLIQQAKVQLPLLIDQGGADPFCDDQLKPESLLAAAEEANYPVMSRYREGYDHSYFYISSFIDEHLAFHHSYLYPKA